MRQYQNTTAVHVPPDVDPLMEHALTQNVERDVAVPLFQNFVGGVGVATVIMAVGLLWMRDVSVELLIWAGCCGLGAFGLASLVRAFRDEVSYVAYHWARGWAEGRAIDELDILYEENDRLRAANIELRNTAAQMSKFVSAEQARPRPEKVDDEYTEMLRNAIALCRFGAANGTVARDRIVDSKLMSKSQYASARSLLEDAGVTIRNGVMATEVSLAVGMVTDFVEKQRASVEGFVQPSVPSADRTGLV
jgi:hypothetical protein